MKFHWYLFLLYTVNFVFGIAIIIPLSKLAATSLSLYAGYSIYIDNWANNKINELKDVYYKTNISDFNVLKNKYMISDYSSIIENIHYRNLWNNFLFNYNEKQPYSIGKYKFFHRNCINHEEKLALCNSKNAAHKLILKLKNNGFITVLENKSIILNENLLFLSFIPINITWIGNIKNNQVFWNYTEIKLPFKTYQNTNTTKELSKYPWNITASNEYYIIFKKDRTDINDMLIYSKF